MLKLGFKKVRHEEGIKGFPISLIPLALSLLLFILCLVNTDAASAATITLTWDPPVSNNDGTPYTNLSGYRVYYGTSSGNYSQSIDVSNVVTYTLDNLSDGVTYYFVTTAYDTSNIETPYSNEIHCLNTTSSCVGGGSGDGGGGGSNGGGGGDRTQTTLNSSGDTSIGGGGCGFIKTDDGKGPKANGEVLSMIMLFLLLILLKLKKLKIPVCRQAGM